MKVFISWSGDLSNKIGEKFRTWLPGVLQAVTPYYTPSDIEKGSRWEASLSKELETSEVGIFLITSENLNSHWMIFEAGALAKKPEKSRVCPILFGVEDTHLPGPLRQLQATPFKKEEMLKLILDINKALGSQKLAESVVNKTFEMWWPDLNRDIQEILDAHTHAGDEPEKEEKEILNEILELSRLSVRRATATGINPKAFAHLVAAVERTHNSIKGREADEEIMRNLETIKEPLKYLSERTRGNGIDELSQKVEGLVFEVDPFDEDDDIPF